MDSLRLNYSHSEYGFMLLQCGLIACVMAGWPRRLRWPDRPLSPSTCMLAICIGWSCRLAAVFVLASIGFVYLQADDACRWMLAWEWRKAPFFVFDTGTWQPGTFVLHGLTMKIVDDPLIATKLVAALFCLAPLIGMFLYAMGVFNDRRVACVSVLATAPLWLHLLLSTGALSEMPTLAFMLSGAGLLLIALRRPSSVRRFWILAAAALMFDLATAFHTAAWMTLAAILAALFVYANFRWGRNGQFRFRHWLVFSLASGVFCATWLVACWRRFGDPFHTFTQAQANLVRDYGARHVWTALLAYPYHVVFALKSVLPLLVFGMAWSWLADGRDRGCRRGALAAIGLGLLVMVATAIHGIASLQARSTIILSTALVPFMIAPFFPGSSLADPAARERPRPLNAAQKILFGGLATLAGCLFLLANYQNLISRQRTTGDDLKSDSVAMGAWLRQELIRPQSLRAANLALPVRVWPPYAGNLDFFQLIYGAGFLNRIEVDSDPVFKNPRPGQVVVSSIECKDPRLTLVARVGSYFVYECKESIH